MGALDSKEEELRKKRQEELSKIEEDKKRVPQRTELPAKEEPKKKRTPRKEREEEIPVEPEIPSMGFQPSMDVLRGLCRCAEVIVPHGSQSASVMGKQLSKLLRNPRSLARMFRNILMILEMYG